MNTKTLLASVVMLALTLLQSSAQQPQAVIQIPAQQVQAPIPDQITVNILGEVNRPARVALPKGSGLLDALASAGGFTRTANPGNILVIHKGTGAKPETVKVNLKPIVTGVTKDIMLKDGDTVVVGEAIF